MIFGWFNSGTKSNVESLIPTEAINIAGGWEDENQRKPFRVVPAFGLSQRLVPPRPSDFIATTDDAALTWTNFTRSLRMLGMVVAAGDFGPGLAPKRLESTDNRAVRRASARR